jgi:hypothetical protein
MRNLLLASVLTAIFACGCEASPSPQAPAPAEAQAPDMTRDLAIRMARTDASVRYGNGWIAWVDAQKLGRYWVVELRSAGGPGLRYAISIDGAIKARDMLQ